MNLFSDLLASSNGSISKTGPRIQQRRGIELKSLREIKIMRDASKIVATVLKEIESMVSPGMTTGDLDEYAERTIREMGATPSFKGYQGFPSSICASINNEVVHGIPSSKRIIKSGDLLKVDTGAYFDGYHGDSCITICVGEVSEIAKELSRVAQEALNAGISKVKPKNTLMDIAGAVEDVVKENGFSVVEDYTGHGVGRNLHEEPSVFNFRTTDLPNVTLRPGMTLAIEPIVNSGSKACKTLKDGWTVVTQDGSLSAQWEHTVLVTSKGFEILTERNN
ncbi:type I methionyl aminopeptidase [Prochlorococcus sp. MIT 1223]|uniref:type I methionyl aminopeptidase n=1 Tax=Prochlorococcus sp. MIT 1223 TaxID=3096217 RepID=UPI002A74FCA0|nr:type I methionyl aminopeptidase [Prochlorococcus sp. MIT 1223]